MPLFHKKTHEDAPFNKDNVIREIKENKDNNLPHWDWLIPKEGAFECCDFVFFKPCEIKEEIHRDQNPYNPYKKIIDSIYQTIAAVYISEPFKSPEMLSYLGHPGVISIKVKSAKDLYRMLKKIDSSNGG